MRVSGIAVVAFSVLLVGGYSNSEANVSVDLEENCWNLAPPSGFVGPNPTIYCALEWPSGPVLIHFAKHRAEAQVVVPNQGVTDTGEVTLNDVFLQGQDIHYWVVQRVCTGGSSTILGRLDGLGSGWRVVPAPPPVYLDTIRVQNASDFISANISAHNC